MPITPKDPDELPPELEHLYDSNETFKIDASPEEVVKKLFGDTGI